MSGEICPKDLKYCIDDCCRGAGCVQMQGEPMLHTCRKCGAIQEYFVLYGCDDCDELDENNESEI